MQHAQARDGDVKAVAERSQNLRTEKTEVSMQQASIQYTTQE